MSWLPQSFSQACGLLFHLQSYQPFPHPLAPGFLLGPRAEGAGGSRASLVAPFSSLTPPGVSRGSQALSSPDVGAVAQPSLRGSRNVKNGLGRCLTAH